MFSLKKQIPIIKSQRLCTNIFTKLSILTCAIDCVVSVKYVELFRLLRSSCN
jgi:hypothetical protein